jgi:hypothetical protein
VEVVGDGTRAMPAQGSRIVTLMRPLYTYRHWHVRRLARVVHCPVLTGQMVFRSQGSSGTVAVPAKLDTALKIFHEENDAIRSY